jgi:uncharacterized protein (TIGR02118 family)
VIRITFCLHRLPHLTREAFQAYWRQTHAPLVASVCEVLRIRRYEQFHTGFDDIGAGAAAPRAAPSPYDGVAELWWHSIEDLAATFEDPEAREAGRLLLEDEAKFIDLPRSPIFFGQVHTVF